MIHQCFWVWPEHSRVVCNSELSNYSSAILVWPWLWDKNCSLSAERPLFCPTNPPMQILREDLSSLGVYPSVVSAPAGGLLLAGDHRAWDVSWDSIPGNAMESADFSCTGADVATAYTGEATCSTALLAASAGGASLSGTFALTISSTASASTITHGGEDASDDTAWGEAAETTTYLDFDATPAEVQAALEALTGVAAVDVELVNSLPSSSLGGGSSFLVTFLGATGATSPIGGLSLAALSAGLFGTGAETKVREVYPGSRWGGEFALSIGGLEGSSLPFDAEAEGLQEAVSALVAAAHGGDAEDTDSVEVWREDSEAGFRWVVAFAGGLSDGDIDLMEVRRMGRWKCETYCNVVSTTGYSLCAHAGTCKNKT